MEKLFKGPLSIIAIMLAFMLGLGMMAPPAYADVNLTGACGQALSVAGETYHMTVDIDCSDAEDWPCCDPNDPDKKHVYGVIITAPNVTLDGHGKHIIGGNADDKCCEVVINPGNDPDPGWCTDHPCRNGLTDDAGKSAICTGVLNANPVGGQGGYSGVTVKNVEISGFCDGIFMSGDCNPERRLTGILIEGNYIHDNGKDCGCYVHSGGEEGYYPHPNFNDAIYLAQVGIDAPGVGIGVFPECEECRMLNPFPECLPVDEYLEFPDLIECTGGCAEPWCECCKPLWAAEIDPPPVEGGPVKVNIVRHNLIYSQKGCAKISCPGGNGINLNGGLELEDDDLWWSGCNDIYKNVIKNCNFSGIMYQHATRYNRIHGNYCTGNRYGGITDPCDWCEDNYIYDNVLKYNYGPGIGLNAMARIKNNISIDNQPVPDECGKHNLPYPHGGIGIWCGDEAASELVGNTCVGNATADIRAVAAAGAFGDQNKCRTINSTYRDCTPGPRGMCRYDCADRLNCVADLNHDCNVNIHDSNLMIFNEWNYGPMQCCGSPWPQP
ncbi:MAG: hypothetical protein BA874_09685 [Desulfuromonadales bacterium C00003068]|jgi:hypothetical protein|nr:MAG: hypothetical protein BA874_09685 [Desulfuromonadales bacterium C00003068]